MLCVYLRRAATVLAAFACSTAPAASQGDVPVAFVVSDPACPLRIEHARVEPAAGGIFVVYSVRNPQKDTVREIVLTYAAADWMGQIAGVKMTPVSTRISRGAATQQQVFISTDDVQDASLIVIGIQAVRWASKKTAEWRGALTMASPNYVAARPPASRAAP